MTGYDGGTSVGWHRHDAAYFTYVMSGRYRERVHRDVRQCSARHLVIHRAGEVHADEFSTAARCMNIEFDPQWIARLESQGVKLDAPAVVESNVISSLFARAVRELRCCDALSSVVLEGLMLEAFGEIGRAERRSDVPRWLSRVRDEIASRFREPLSTTTLAAEAGVHTVHLARSFRRHFRRTIGETIRELRVDFARSRILAGCDLAQIAIDAGFADQSHFTRTFRNVTGLTPAEFRRNSPKR